MSPHTIPTPLAYDEDRGDITGPDGYWVARCWNEHFAAQIIAAVNERATLKANEKRFIEEVAQRDIKLREATTDAERYRIALERVAAELKRAPRGVNVVAALVILRETLEGDTK